MKSKSIITYLLLAVFSLLLITLDLTDRVSALKNFIRFILFPSPQIVMKAVSETGKIAGNISGVIRVFEENRELKREIEQLRYFEAQYKFLQKENTLLHKMMDISKKEKNVMVSALVISRDPANWFNTIIIDKGASSGIGTDMPVIAVSGKSIGLVGRTIETGGNYSKIMLITDPLSYIPVNILRNGEMCIVSGRNNAELLLDYLSPGVDIRIGDSIVTSGIGEIFPGGIPVGTVTGRMFQSKTYFFQASLKPVVSPGKIKKVLVITK